MILKDKTGDMLLGLSQ